MDASVKKSQKDDLMIFNDLGMNEDTLVRCEIRQEPAKKSVAVPLLFDEVCETDSEQSLCSN